MKSLSSFTHTQIVPILYDFICSALQSSIFTDYNQVIVLWFEHSVTWYFWTIIVILLIFVFVFLSVYVIRYLFRACIKNKLKHEWCTGNKLHPHLWLCFLMHVFLEIWRFFLCLLILILNIVIIIIQSMRLKVQCKTNSVFPLICW